MPYKQPKPCRRPGCPELTHNGYCAKHQAKYLDQQRQSKAFYDRKRPSRSKRGYTRRWYRYREGYLQAHPLCINFDDCRRPAEVIDHIKPVAAGGEFWDAENHQAMCKSCHDRKTATEDGGFGHLHTYAN